MYTRFSERLGPIDRIIEIFVSAFNLLLKCTKDVQVFSSLSSLPLPISTIISKVIFLLPKYDSHLTYSIFYFSDNIIELLIFLRVEPDCNLPYSKIDAIFYNKLQLLKPILHLALLQQLSIDQWANIRQLLSRKCLILVTRRLQAGMKQLSRSILAVRSAVMGKMLEINRSTLESMVLSRSLSNCLKEEDADILAVLKICS